MNVRGIKRLAGLTLTALVIAAVMCSNADAKSRGGSSRGRSGRSSNSRSTRSSKSSCSSRSSGRYDRGRSSSRSYYGRYSSGHSSYYRSSRHGSHFSLGFGIPARISVPTVRKYISGYYQTRTESIKVRDGYHKHILIPAVTKTVKGRHGETYTVVVEDARYERVWIPAQYVSHEVKVWVPGYYVDVPRSYSTITSGLSFRVNF